MTESGPGSQASPQESYKALRKEGRLGDALRLARRAIPTLEPNAVAQMGKWLVRDLPVAPESGLPARPVSVRVLGQCTTSYLPPLITAWAWTEGLRAQVADGAYDQVIQELMQMTPETAPEVIVLLPWNQRLLGHDGRGPIERVEDEMIFLQQAWAQVERLRSKLVQVTYDWTEPGALGYGLGIRRSGDAGLVAQVNASLRASLPAGAFLVDLETISAWHGKSRMYDPRNYHWLKQPFSQEGLSQLGRHIAVGLRALCSGRRKVLVLDLDNTVWGGVVGEAGPHGIVIGGAGEGEAFAALQRLARKLRDSGVLLAVCSKNNPADAQEPFEKNDQMILRMEDFASFHASWDSKPSRLRQMAAELNLGLDSFVFFDDNPAERERMRAELPEVLVVEAPSDPAEYVRALQQALAFEAVDLTSADADRAGQYQAEAARRDIQSRAASPEEYLASLQMRAEVQPVDAAIMDRVVDLITKTNQFNLTTRRHSRAAVETLCAASRSVCFAVRLQDKFGDYGLISVMLAMPESNEPSILRIDTWLMSCRAMGRTVEHFVLNELAARARALGFDRLRGEYLPTPKNVPVQNLLQGFGFQPDADENLWILELAGCPPCETQVSL